MARSRYLVPAGVAAAIAIGTGVPHLTSASAATPDLPRLSAAQLLVKAQHAHVPGLTGTVRWSADLGLPSLSALTSGAGQDIPSGSFDPTSLLSGTHDISVWDAGATEQRLAIPGSLTETDVVRDGRDLYTYDSATQHVTHVVLPAPRAGHGEGDAPEPGPATTPDQAAAQLLDHLTPSTAVSVVDPVYVAGRAAYELALAPRSAQSTVGSVTIAVDAATGLPLQVQVTPRGGTTPALSLGYVGTLDLAAPPASTFAAPHGATTSTKVLGADHGRHPGDGAGTRGAPADRGDATATPGGGSGAGATIGSGWTTVASFDLPATATAGTGRHRGASVLGELRRVGRPVTGSFGTATLVTSNLLDVLVLPDGHVLAGFVTPATLEAAAAQAATAPAAA